ncbi:MAG TPA: response regulator transcription factor [Burkholderiales bacterium]|nr:response regulator transcription factor [Burkholderiales bacterium]
MSGELLLVDDDATFREVFGRALRKRGFGVATAHDVPSAEASARRAPPDYAVLDLRMPGESGLALIGRLRQLNPDMRIVVLTGYASIATAVEAVKLGATHYLAKPTDVDEVVEALGATRGNAAAPLASTPLSVERLEWEHIQRVLAEHGGNVSATARALNMHRRTLQRKLAKRPVRA